MEPTEVQVPKRQRSPLRYLQATCLVAIPMICLMIIVFVAVFAVKCNKTGGFMFTPKDGIVCLASPKRSFDMSGREVHVSSERGEGPDNGEFMMNLTRMVLVIVAVLIFGFTAWICVWYRMYGRKTPPAGSEAGQNCAERSPIFVYQVEGGGPVKPDLERLLGVEVVTPSSA